MEPGAIRRAALDGHLSFRLSRVRALVYAEVNALRGQGLAPERMLIEMKSVVMPVLAVGRIRCDQYGPAEALMSRIVLWCAQAYYANSA